MNDSLDRYTYLKSKYEQDDLRHSSEIDLAIHHAFKLQSWILLVRLADYLYTKKLKQSTKQTFPPRYRSLVYVS